MRKVPKAKFDAYLRRAQGFASCARDAAAKEEWDVAVANAVHAAISMSDALTVYYSGQRSAEQSHETIELFLSLSIEKKELDRNARHLTSLLKVKSSAEYEERPLRSSEGREGLQHMTRFLEWAFTKLPVH